MDKKEVKRKLQVLEEREETIRKRKRELENLLNEYSADDEGDNGDMEERYIVI